MVPCCELYLGRSAVGGGSLAIVFYKLKAGHMASVVHKLNGD